MAHQPRTKNVLENTPAVRLFTVRVRLCDVSMILRVLDPENGKLGFREPHSPLFATGAFCLSARPFTTAGQRKHRVQCRSEARQPAVTNARYLALAEPEFLAHVTERSSIGVNA